MRRFLARLRTFLHCARAADELTGEINAHLQRLEGDLAARPPKMHPTATLRTN